MYHINYLNSLKSFAKFAVRTSLTYSRTLKEIFYVNNINYSTLHIIRNYSKRQHNENWQTTVNELNTLRIRNIEIITDKIRQV